MEHEYRYCNKCLKPIPANEKDDGFDICGKCAAELIRKIYEDQSKGRFPGTV